MYSTSQIRKWYMCADQESWLIIPFRVGTGTTAFLPVHGGARRSVRSRKGKTERTWCFSVVRREKTQEFLAWEPQVSCEGKRCRSRWGQLEEHGREKERMVLEE